MKLVPAALRDLPQWVVWRIGQRSDGDKPTKLPYSVNGQLAKSNDAATWTTFDAAVACWRSGRYAGIGFMFAADDPFCGIDLDGCRDAATGTIAPWALAILKQLMSYSEVSPSQTGIKTFVRAALPFNSGRKIAVKEPKVCDKEPAVEVYDKLRYFAVTGDRIGTPVDVEPRQEQVNELCARLWPDQTPTQADWHSAAAVVERCRKYLAKCPPAVSGSNGHGATFHAACICVLGFGMNEGESLALLREWNQTCQPPWTDRELEHKVKDALRQPGPRNFLRLAKPDNYSAIAVPTWHEPERKPERQIQTTTLRAAALNYCDKIANGSACAVETGLPDLDYAIGGGVEFGEMVIVAGRPGHGKSAVALQAVHGATARGMSAVFISEEMSPIALGKRVVQFAAPIHQELWKSKAADVRAAVETHFSQRAECYVAESCGTAEHAAEAVRRHVAEHGVKFAVIDYAQLLGGKGKGRYEQVTNTSIILRQLANETKIVLMVLAQLNREIEKRQKFVPTTADLRDTGQLEQDADVIVFCVWPYRITQNESQREHYQFFVSKNRNRPINQAVVECVFDPMRQMLKLVAPQWPGEGVTSRDIQHVAFDGF